MTDLLDDFVLGVDLDGVCADYTTAFAQVVAEERDIDVAYRAAEAALEAVTGRADGK